MRDCKPKGGTIQLYYTEGTEKYNAEEYAKMLSAGITSFTSEGSKLRMRSR